MNQVQRKHIIFRIKEIANKKCNEIQEKMPRVKDNPLTFGIFTKLLKAKKIQLADSYKNTSVNHAGILDAFICAREYHHPVPRGEPVYDKKEYDKLIAPINKREVEIIDEIMLGDAEEALKLLRDFENDIN
jgi:hypothetical protein